MKIEHIWYFPDCFTDFKGSLEHICQLLPEED